MNISSIVVQVRSEKYDDVKNALETSGLCDYHFGDKEKGKIINIASLAGEVGGIATSADYVASKAAVIGITKSLARYLGPYNINVNAVAPGFIATDMTAAMSIPTGSIPLRRSGQPDDVANGIVFLASDRADYITGTTLDINGGLYMK